MNANIHGLPQTQLQENTVEILYDELHYATGASVVDTQFFGPGIFKDEQYQNFRLPSEQTTVRTVLGLRIEHGMQFAVGSNTGKEAQYQEYFERNSFIYVQKEKKEYTRFPLCDLLPQSLYFNSSSVVMREKWDDYYQLSPTELIELPPNGRISFHFAPAAGLTTAATGIAPLPQSYITSSLTNDMGFFVRLKLYCAVVQKVV